MSSQLTRGSCDNIGGYFATDSAVSNSTTTSSGLARCYYSTFDCPGYELDGQCYTHRSSSMSCSTCDNIGGQFTTNDTCYYYSADCPYLSVGQQCHTNKYVAPLHTASSLSL